MIKKPKAKNKNTQQGIISGYTIKYLPLMVQELHGGSLTKDPKIVVSLEVRRKNDDGRPISVHCPQKERLMKGVEPTSEIMQMINNEVIAAFPINSECHFTETLRTRTNKDEEEYTVTQYKLVE